MQLTEDQNQEVLKEVEELKSKMISMIEEIEKKWSVPEKFQLTIQVEDSINYRFNAVSCFRDLEALASLG